MPVTAHAAFDKVTSPNKCDCDGVYVCCSKTACSLALSIIRGLCFDEYCSMQLNGIQAGSYFGVTVHHSAIGSDCRADLNSLKVQTASRSV